MNLSKVIEKIRPSERDKKKAMNTFSEIKDFIEEKYKVEAKLVGSIGKDTFLKEDKNLDIFIFFPIKTSRKQLEKKGLEIGKAIFRKYKGEYQIEYAEHPYTKGKINGFELDIVPAYKIKDSNQPMSAVDRTPFHLEYVIKHLKNADDVRLLKKFLRGINCYGSDLKNMGFSGYLCELVVIKYNNFENVLRNVQNWKFQQIIDLEKVYSVKYHKKLKKRFKGQPLIFIDPVDKNRNVAAVLSKETYSTFIFNARKYLKKPSLEYFFPRVEKPNKRKLMSYVKKKKTNIIVIEFKKPDVIEDILYPQLRRFERNLIRVLKEKDFVVLDSWIFGNSSCGVVLEVVKEQLPTYKKVYGPSIFNPEKYQEAFIKKHKKVWFDDERFVTEMERKHVNTEDFLRDYLKKSKKKLIDQGVPNHVADSLNKRFRIVRDISKIKVEEFWKGLEKTKVS